MDQPTPDDLRRVSGDRYEVDSVIGRGGMGVVYLAKNRELGSRVAIKVMQGIALDGQRLARFRREAALSAQLTHPNIVPVFEFQVMDEVAYLVMPYIDGVPLDQHLRRHGALPKADVQQMLEQIGGALHYAHSKGVVHRDVKPSNILYERESGRWMLTDFGVAHVDLEGITALTASEATIGTLTYMAPEQLGGSKNVDGRADLYALALVATEALMGVQPEREGPEETARLVLSRTHNVSSAWARVLTWPLAAARDERPPTGIAWLTKLRQADTASRRPALVGVVGSLIVLALAWTGFRILAPAPPPPRTIVAVPPIEVIDHDNAISPAQYDSLLTLGITTQIQMIPTLEVLNETRVRTAIVSRFGGGYHGRDTLLSVAEGLAATEVVMGSAEVRNGRITLTLQILDPNGREITGFRSESRSLDSLTVLINEAVEHTFAERFAEALSGIRNPSLPEGIEAAIRYFRGVMALRRGALETALTQFEDVIAADPEFAPARLNRAVALIYSARPTAAGAEIRAALDSAEVGRDRLDPVNGRILDAMVAMMRDGHIRRGDSILQDVVLEHPNAIDARFLLGAVRARFPAITGSGLIDARNHLTQVTVRDPSFGLAHGVLLQIDALLDDRRGVENAVAGYLAMDSTSPRAAVVRFMHALIVRQSIDATSDLSEQPILVLENVATGAGVFAPPSGTRPVAAAATRRLFEQATARERPVYGTMVLATLIGSGEIDRAQRFVENADVPQSVRDRWIVLSAVTPLPYLAPSSQVPDAVQRLRAPTDAPLESAWLVARWARMYDRALIRTADDTFRASVPGNAGDSIVARSFAWDLRAFDALQGSQPDTLGALAAWDSATSRYALDRAMFGLVESWWPMHLERIIVSAALGDTAMTRRNTDHFRSFTGFSDQMAWYHAFSSVADLAQAHGDTDFARTTYLQIQRNLTVGTDLRDSIQSRLARLTPEAR